MGKTDDFFFLGKKDHESAHALLIKPEFPFSINLAIVETDCTTVYYKLMDGFIMADHLDNPEDADSKQGEKRKRLLR